MTKFDNKIYNISLNIDNLLANKIKKKNEISK